MKAIIFHGTDCKPSDYWYGWLGQQLEASGYAVEIPSYPNINHEPIETFLPKVLAKHSFNDETVLVGHSAAGPLILSILEHIDGVIPKSVLVAGYSKRFPNEAKDPVLQESYNWGKIKSHVKDIYFINSVNDPWGCDDKQGRIMFEHLGGTQIIRNDGHFGSTRYNQPCPTFPLLKALILEADGE
jgi:uncharacterized protein